MAITIKIPSKALKSYLGYSITRRRSKYTNGTVKYTYIARPLDRNNQHVIEGRTLEETHKMIRHYRLKRGSHA